MQLITVCDHPLISLLVALDLWHPLALSLVVVDPSIRDFDVAHISTTATSNFSVARDFCLWGKGDILLERVRQGLSQVLLKILTSEADRIVHYNLGDLAGRRRQRESLHSLLGSPESRSARESVNQPMRDPELGSRKIRGWN
jgi:hypothetical protein